MTDRLLSIGQAAVVARILREAAVWLSTGREPWWRGQGMSGLRLVCSHARCRPDHCQPGGHGRDRPADQPCGRVPEVEGKADAEAVADHDGGVVAVDAYQAAFPEPVVLPAGASHGT